MTEKEFSGIALMARETLPPSVVSWDGSPYGWMRHMGPVSKSALGREMIRIWMETKGWHYEVGPGGTDGYHFLSGGKRLAVHFATLGKDGHFRFSALRVGGMGCDGMLLLGVEPSRARIWYISVEDVAAADLASFKGDIDGLFSLTFDPDDVPQWISAGLAEEVTT